MKSLAWCWAMTCQLTPLLTLYWSNTARSAVSTWFKAELQLSVCEMLPICSTNMILLQLRGGVESVSIDLAVSLVKLKHIVSLQNSFTKFQNTQNKCGNKAIYPCSECYSIFSLYSVLYLALERSRGLEMACLILHPLKYRESP